MTFQLSFKPEELKWPVKVHKPSDTKPGKFDVKTFYVTFKVMRFDEWIEATSKPGSTPGERVRSYVTAWDIQGPDGNTVDLNNDDMVSIVLNTYGIGEALMSAYLDCIGGGAKRKN